MAAVVPAKTSLFRLTVVGMCAYEVVAIVSGRLPTISRGVRRFPLFGAVVVGGLHLHFREGEV